MKWIVKFLVILMSIVVHVWGQTIPSPAEQIAAALQAAPPEFRAKATVLGYNSDGKLVTLRKGSGVMICLADNPFEPGFSVAAYHKDLEPFMARGRELRAEGKNREEVFRIREAEARSGKLKMPERGATLHVLSGPNAWFDPKSGKVRNAVYRAVVYIPWATSESTGLPKIPVVPGAPWIMDPGTHRAHIMINPPAETQK